MAVFSQVVKEARRPGRTLVLEPWVFADEWANKPDSAVCIGLRLMSEADKAKAKGESEKLAFELHPKDRDGWIDAFNDSLIRQVAALGVCDPNDVTKPSQILPFAEEQVRVALTSRGARFIFEAIDRYEIEASPIGFEITQEELSELVTLLQATDVATLPPGLRRLAHHVLGELSARSSGQ